MLALSLGAFSCNTENPADKGVSPGDGQTGEVTINLGFGKTPQTQAYPQSTRKPSTSWNQNIHDLQILFVDRGSQMIKAVRELPLPTAGDIAAKPFVLQNIPASASPYDVYVIANSGTGNIVRPWEPAGSVGFTIQSRILQLKEKALGEKPAPPAEDPEKDSKGYEEPSEIFVGVLPNVTVGADQTNDFTGSPIELTRIVSLLRVRINQSMTASASNQTVDFKTADASFRIRRVGTSIDPQGLVTFAAPKRETAVLYVKGAFNDAEPQSGYGPGSILDPGTGLTLWKDILLFPGGSATTGNEKFDIVLIGHAPATYVPLGKTTAIGGNGGLVAWTGAVQKPVAANGILEVNLTLNSSGKWIDDPNDPEPGIPTPGAFGNVEINVELVEWGNIESDDIIL